MLTKILTVAAASAMALMIAASASAQDAMSSDGMAMDAMAPMMSDEDLSLCIEQAKAITFPDVAIVAEQACHTLHNGHGSLGGDAMMGGDAMPPKP